MGGPGTAVIGSNSRRKAAAITTTTITIGHYYCGLIFLLSPLSLFLRGVAQTASSSSSSDEMCGSADRRQNTLVVARGGYLGVLLLLEADLSVTLANEPSDSLRVVVGQVDGQAGAAQLENVPEQVEGIVGAPAVGVVGAFLQKTAEDWVVRPGAAHLVQGGLISLLHPLNFVVQVVVGTADVRVRILLVLVEGVSVSSETVFVYSLPRDCGVETYVFMNYEGGGRRALHRNNAGSQTAGNRPVNTCAPERDRVRLEHC